MKNKRGQLGNLSGIVLTLVIVGILIGVGFVILSSLITNLQKSESVTNTVNNETVSIASGGGYLVYNYSTANVTCYNTPTILYVTNSSGAPAVMDGTTGRLTAANYTVNSAGLFQNVSGAGSALYNRAWNVSYTYLSGGDACRGVQDTSSALKNIPTFLPILVIIMIVGILLAIVFQVLPGARGGRETAYV